MSDPKELVSVYQGANVTEAHFVMNLLLDEGIEAFVSEENEPLAGLSIAAPDVLVRREDQQRARAIIEEYDKEQESAPTGPTGSARPAARRCWAPSTNATPAEPIAPAAKRKMTRSDLRATPPSRPTAGGLVGRGAHHRKHRGRATRLSFPTRRLAPRHRPSSSPSARSPAASSRSMRSTS